jgi:hypothetical protein
VLCSCPENIEMSKFSRGIKAFAAHMAVDGREAQVDWVTGGYLFTVPPEHLVLLGFSGHGMMHAPAAGRGVAEPIGHGEFRTLDVRRFGHERIVQGEPYAERGIV